MAQFVMEILIVTLELYHSITAFSVTSSRYLCPSHIVPGARCRFASSSASQGSCVFPCRCTNGCDTTTGQCVNGGQCTTDKPDKPTDLGWRWTGIACQEGSWVKNIIRHVSQTKQTQIYIPQAIMLLKRIHYFLCYFYLNNMLFILCTRKYI